MAARGSSVAVRGSSVAVRGSSVAERARRWPREDRASLYEDRASLYEDRASLYEDRASLYEDRERPRRFCTKSSAITSRYIMVPAPAPRRTCPPRRDHPDGRPPRRHKHISRGCRRMQKAIVLLLVDLLFVYERRVTARAGDANAAQGRPARGASLRMARIYPSGTKPS